VRATYHKMCECVTQGQQSWRAAVSLPVAETRLIFYPSCKFFSQFLVINTLSPDWIRIRIGIQTKMLDPDQTNMDPKKISLRVS
jgi:hypothetical protein